MLLCLDVTVRALFIPEDENNWKMAKQRSGKKNECPEDIIERLNQPPLALVLAMSLLVNEIIKYPGS